MALARSHDHGRTRAPATALCGSLPQSRCVDHNLNPEFSECIPNLGFLLRSPSPTPHSRLTHEPFISFRPSRSTPALRHTPPLLFLSSPSPLPGNSALPLLILSSLPPHLPLKHSLLVFLVPRLPPHTVLTPLVWSIIDSTRAICHEIVPELLPGNGWAYSPTHLTRSAHASVLVLGGIVFG